MSRPLHILLAASESRDASHRSSGTFAHLLHGLAARGNSVSAVAPAPWLDSVASHEVRISVPLPPSTLNLTPLRRVRRHVSRVLRDAPVDIVHAFGLWPVGAALEPMAKGQFRLIIHCDHADIQLARRSRLHRLLMARAARQAEALVCPSRRVRQDLSRLFRRTAIVLPFADLLEGRPTPLPGSHRPTYAVASLGNTAEDHLRQDALLLDLKALQPFRPTVVHLMGNRDAIERCERRAREMNVRDCLVLQMDAGDSPRLIADSSCYIALGRASTDDTELSSALRTALFLGKPVIYAATETTRDLLAHMQTGVQVEPNSPGAYAEALIFLGEHPEMARVMGQNAREFITWYLDSDRLFRELDATYRNFALSQLDSLRYFALQPTGSDN